MSPHLLRPPSRPWRFVFTGLLLGLLALGAFQLRSSLAASAVPPGGAQPAAGNMVVGSSYKNDTSPALRDLPPAPIQFGAEKLRHDNVRLPMAHKDALDTVVQRALAPLAIPAPILNFDGTGFPGVGCNCSPPDTNGEVGATQYVQMVNEGYQVFNKTTGASVLGPNSITSLWTGFGGACQTGGFGDPVVLYDQLANRWVITEFASATGGTPITDECIAVSQTSDATGVYNRYGFHLGNNFFDYPHLGVWPDAYYMSMNVFNAAGTIYLGPQPYALDRAKMLLGQSATFQTTSGTLGSTVDPILPADLDGAIQPAAGAVETFLGFPGSGIMTLYHYHVDWTTPANSTFTTFANPPAAAFTTLCAANGTCVPQLSTGQQLDGLSDRMMFRLAYRKFSTGQESLIGNYSVSSGGVAGIRWFELRNPTVGPVTVFQESTYQPDTTWRWMGATAMDAVGDLAIGFSASSATIKPQIRYAGRLVSDPINTLAQGEAHLFDGSGAQTGSNRWGDYSDLTVDPTDDCTFYYTTEYYAANASVNWRTRIGSFRFPSCGAITPTPTATATGPLPTATATATATACAATNYTASPTTGVIVPGVTDTGNHCDDCTTPLTLPFPLTLYGVQYTTGSVSSNGNLQFGGTSTSLGAACLPNPAFTSPTIFLYQDDLRTDGAGDGIFTLVTGTAPNRTYIIEWRTTYFGRAGNSNEELVFAENNPNQVSMVYGANADNGTGETSGVQQSPTGLFTQYSCTTATLTAGLRVDYRQIPCGGTTTVTTTGTPATATRTSTALATVTATPTACGAAAGWTAGANFPLTGITRPVGAYYPANGRFYTLGGRTSDTAGSDLPNPYEYNPANNTWTTKAATFADNQVNNMAGGVLTVAGTDTIVVVGGSAAGATSATAAVRYYNPVTDVLTVVTSDPWPGDANGTTLPGGYAVANNKLYILGSFNINVAMTTDIWQYDPSAAAGSRWLQRVNLPLARGYIPATSIGNVIYTGGGSDYVGGTVTDNPDSFRFDPVANTITTIAPIPRATGETRAVTLNGKMWVLGGGRVAPNPNNEVDIYDPGTNAWTLGLPFVNARRNDGAGTDGSRIFLVGGYAPTVPTNSLEIYTSAVPCGTATVTATSVANTPTVTRTSVANTATVTSVAATTTATSVGATTTATSVGATTTATSVPANTSTATSVPANTSTATSVPANTSTVTRVPSATPCTIRFSDVTDPTTYYYQGVYYLACHGVISGYSDGTYRPFNNTTRGQMTKIVTLAFNIPLVTPPATGTFTDVLPDNVFYQLIETAAARGIVSGYTCGGINSQTGTPEPCDGARRPYFRPSNFVTRGQLTKIVVLGAGFPLLNPPTPTFTDVVPSNVFYQSIETAVCHGAITSYDDHTFRPNNYAFRGQIAKIVYLAVTNPAGTCPAGMPITH